MGCVMRHKMLIVLLLLAALAVAVVAVVAVAERGPATSSALEPTPTPTTAPPPWLLEGISQEARNCGDPHAFAWWTLTTAQKAAVIEGLVDHARVFLRLRTSLPFTPAGASASVGVCVSWRTGGVRMAVSRGEAWAGRYGARGMGLRWRHPRSHPRCQPWCHSWCHRKCRPWRIQGGDPRTTTPLRGVRGSPKGLATQGVGSGSP